MDKTPASIFRKQHNAPSVLPSSSPAFGTPIHPLKPFNVAPPKATILPIILPPATLRPIAFRNFTKKHSLTLTSSALQELATFVGRNCGSGWREEGLAERVLEEVARGWKNRNGGVIVEGSSKELHEALKTLEGNMRGGKVVGPTKGLPRGDSMLDARHDDAMNTRLGLRPETLSRGDSTASFGLSSLGMQDEADEEEANDPRAWLKIIDAYNQPRLNYNVSKRHFERETAKPSLLPPPSQKTTFFCNRYHIIHQRLLRNEAFQTSSVSSSRPRTLQRSLSAQKSLKITPIANMLGRHGSTHMLLGLLNVLPPGDLAISDLTGTIALDLRRATIVPEDSAWFCPGMIVLLDGVYEEMDAVGKGLSGSSGVGGTLGGRFQGFFIGQPPSETRKAMLGISGPDGGPDHTIGGGFGWIDFLGMGSERAVGAKMRKLEQRLLPPAPSETPGRSRIIILGEVNLDQPCVLQALRKILAIYAAEPVANLPLSFVLTGSFTEQAVMAQGGSGSSIEYKECFDALAFTLADFPALLLNATFVFVPGDNDGWVSGFTAGAATALPRRAVPDLFTSRVRRVFAAAQAEAGGPRPNETPGAAIWTSNPSRLTLFGPNNELVLFRDDLSARLRRNAVTLQLQAADPPVDASQTTLTPSFPFSDAMDLDAAYHDYPTSTEATSLPSEDVRTAQKLVKTILDQGFLSPFRQTVRPVLWNYAPTLHLDPLPSALALVDTSAPAFCMTYEECHVMNPGSLLVAGRKGVACWVEYEIGREGRLREIVI